MRVTGLFRYPVKSMQGERLERATLTDRGIPGDRRWGVVDADTGRVLSAKREARLLEASARLVDGSPVVELPGGGDADDAALSTWIGRAVHLASADGDDGSPKAYEMNVDAEDQASPVVEIPCPPGTFFDAAPVHLLSTATLRAIARSYPDGDWDVRRFRPTVLVEADGHGFVEDDWIGSTVRMGSAEVSVFAPTVRCAMTIHAQPGLTRDLDIVKAVNRDHQSNLGVYGVVTRPGDVAVGDVVRVAGG